MDEPKWLTWAREVQAIAQSGLAYASDAYDRERYEKLRALAADMMAAGSGEEASRIESLFAREVGYATPKVVVRAAVFNEGKILMVRETSDGAWAPPGGWADVNQSAVECLVREVREESGYEARIVKLAAVIDRMRYPGAQNFPFHVYTMLFVCELTGGSPKTSIETSAVDFFAEDALPELSLFRILPEWIALAFAHYRDPSLPTVFD